MGRAAKNYHRALLNGDAKDYSKMPEPGVVKKFKDLSLSDSVDKAIDNAKGMRKKPYNLEGMKPDKPEKAVSDVTSVVKKKKDNTLSTMDKHGVEDIVRNLSK